MTANLFKVWFFHHLVVQVKDSFVKLKLPEDSKAVLLLDNCKAHPPVAELDSGNIFSTLLPPNITSLMGQGVIQNFKCFYRGSFVQGILNSYCDVANFQKKFNVKDAVYATALSWSEVKKVTLQRCQRKLWKVNPDDDQTEEGEEEDVDTATDEVLNAVRTGPRNNPLENITVEEILEWVDIGMNKPKVS